VAVVLGEFVRRFVAGIEPLGLEPLQCWSYANRLVRGSTKTVSNHGSATAIDINSLKHPRGVHNTFSKAHREIMHDIRDSIVDDAGRPVLRLGMDYVNAEPDDMHVEINANADRVKQAADRIRRQQEAQTVAEKIDPDNWDVHKLTESDAGALGDPKREGEAVSWSSLLRFPPAVARLRTEIGAKFDAIARANTARRAELDQRLNTIEDKLDKIAASIPPPTGK
jgi:hypothetical protein